MNICFNGRNVNLNCSRKFIWSYDPKYILAVKWVINDNVYCGWFWPFVGNHDCGNHPVCCSNLLIVLVSDYPTWMGIEMVSLNVRLTLFSIISVILYLCYFLAVWTVFVGMNFVDATVLVSGFPLASGFPWWHCESSDYNPDCIVFWRLDFEVIVEKLEVSSFYRLNVL